MILVFCFSNNNYLRDLEVEREHEDESVHFPYNSSQDSFGSRILVEQLSMKIVVMSFSI